MCVCACVAIGASVVQKSFDPPTPRPPLPAHIRDPIDSASDTSQINENRPRFVSSLTPCAFLDNEAELLKPRTHVLRKASGSAIH
ncbi:hypothetical protein CABS01_15546 [Colletotrichum abscissum]|uniref:uncharacterized protein n=1 Tax=Colletotrichum abscissum TaxID=1671311 RepID=UPI0027D630C6|nr:uncharacterized protein CABS01_15546 [Colletotrichum abscissum]KAK1475840.1 hypothetical protein CABS01_15546 [Colletotrichum abscissum]